MSGNDWQKPKFTVPMSGKNALHWPSCPAQKDGVKCSHPDGWGHRSVCIFDKAGGNEKTDAN